MTHSNTVHLHQTPIFSLKPLLAIKDFILLLISAFSEAKVMEQASRKTSGNW
jgi:hypothetical protein